MYNLGDEGMRNQFVRGNIVIRAIQGRLGTSHAAVRLSLRS
jgi:hypothetical protein